MSRPNPIPKRTVGDGWLCRSSDIARAGIATLRQIQYWDEAGIIKPYNQPRIRNHHAVRLYGAGEILRMMVLVKLGPPVFGKYFKTKRREWQRVLGDTYLVVPMVTNCRHNLVPRRLLTAGDKAELLKTCAKVRACVHVIDLDEMRRKAAEVSIREPGTR